MSHSSDIEKARRISKALTPSRRWQPLFKTAIDHPDGAEVWENKLYCVTVRRYLAGWPLDVNLPWAQIGIHTLDGSARHDWREFQRIKNDVVGSEWEAIELYPAESRLLDPSNYYILYAAARIPIGKSDPRSVLGPHNCIAPQRGWLD